MDIDKLNEFIDYEFLLYNNDIKCKNCRSSLKISKIKKSNYYELNVTCGGKSKECGNIVQVKYPIYGNYITIIEEIKKKKNLLNKGDPTIEKYNLEIDQLISIFRELNTIDNKEKELKGLTSKHVELIDIKNKLYKTIQNETNIIEKHKNIKKYIELSKDLKSLDQRINLYNKNISYILNISSIESDKTESFNIGDTITWMKDSKRYTGILQKISKKLITILLKDDTVIKRPIDFLSSVELTTDKDVMVTPKSPPKVPVKVAPKKVKLGDNVTWTDKLGDHIGTIKQISKKLITIQLKDSEQIVKKPKDILTIVTNDDSKDIKSIQIKSD